MGWINTIARVSVLSMAATHGLMAAEVATEAPRAPVPAAKGIPLALALEATQASIEACGRKEGKIGVSIVDSAGVLKVLLAADGTSPRGVSSSTDKARTALAFGVATSKLHTQVETDKNLATKIAENPGYNSRPGGILIKSGDQLLGAIGVGGAKIDEECALAGLEKIQSRL
ncbi:heme-binding protein [Methylobacillus gramineus]|uniref:GlcG/HbpS family heme-binding protein n=1 Tax=Methylobacillus gramineus TaxID=755169 RepID=UPI001CFFA005|nr:heme-binding protein [Methylobacillus gramineus]MCB5185493.1 heme-binding protein [Methylobacillus gramineus]